MGEGAKSDLSVPSSPTWAVAIVLTALVGVSMLVERGIHRLSHWLKKTNRSPLYNALEKMKEELMLLGFMSLFLTATSRTISSICIDSRYSRKFTTCTRAHMITRRIEQSGKSDIQSVGYDLRHPAQILYDLSHHTCQEGQVPFTSYGVLEQLDRFVFVMAITHVLYSCLTLLLASIKIRTWRKWEEEVHRDLHNPLLESNAASAPLRQSTFLKFHLYNTWGSNKILLWLTCFTRQFGCSVRRTDYLILRKAFIMNHNLSATYNFHSYMLRSMEDEFKTIVGVSLPLWGFIVCFMLFDVQGSNLYFWIAIIPVAFVVVVGSKLQYIISVLTLENTAITGVFTEAKLKPRDGLFWFKKPELVLSLIHFVLFQNAFELASFFWFWWQFGYETCFMINRWFIHARLILGFLGQFLCSYSTLPLYALVTQMGSNYKSALISPRVRQMVHEWGVAARKRQKRKLQADELDITESNESYPAKGNKTIDHDSDSSGRSTPSLLSDPRHKSFPR